MNEVKIVGDRRLLYCGCFATTCLLTIWLWCIYTVATYPLIKDTDRIIIQLWLILLGIGACLAVSLCINTWQVTYYFSEKTIAISCGIGKKRTTYNAHSFSHSYVIRDTHLSLSLSQRNSRFLLLSQAFISNASLSRLSNIRSIPNLVIIRLDKRNCKALQNVLLQYPQAPYVNKLKQVFSDN